MRIIDSARLATIIEAVDLPEPRVVVSGNHASPQRLLEVIDKALPAYRLFQVNAQPGIPVRAGVRYESPFVGPGMRGSAALDYVPARLSLVPRILATTCQPDIVLIHAAPPRGGALSLGIEVNILPAAIEAARARGALVIAQINPQMPYTFGDGEIPLDLVDYAIECDQALSSPSSRPATGQDDVAAQIGARIARMVKDGATLQTGIGAVPDAVLAELTTHRGLRIWSEMISDGTLHLAQQGALDPQSAITASFLFGSPQLYAWADGNPTLRMQRTETVNDPGEIAKQQAMTSINTALQVDLHAQANASYAHGRIYSGFGGQTDFIVGALHSPGGQAVIALPSWHAKSATSTIVPQLASPVTSFQHTAIVTDQGCADIFGRDQWTQAAHLIDHAAHPDAREQLREAARSLGLAR